VAANARQLAGSVPGAKPPHDRVVGAGAAGDMERVHGPVADQVAALGRPSVDEAQPAVLEELGEDVFEGGRR
jgi:hypothetical protein